MALDPITAALDFGGKIIDKIFPDKDKADAAKLELLKMSQDGSLKEMAMVFESDKSQTAVNEAEAKSTSLFVAGWRPAVGWVCVAAYAFNYLLMPVANWVAKWIDTNAPAIVALDTGELTTLLFGMLGIGGLRTIEKLKGGK